MIRGRWFVMVFSYMLIKKRKTLFNIELEYFCLYTDKGVIVICPCEDATHFSESVLRLLLLSDGGDKILLCAAVSQNDGVLFIRALFSN